MMLSIDYDFFRSEFIRGRAASHKRRKSNQKPFSLISTKERSTSFEGSRIMLSQKVRQTERLGLQRYETAWLTLTPLQLLIVKLERERSRTKRDKYGQIVERAIGANALWDWIAGQLRRSGYPDADVSSVLWELHKISRIKETIEDLRLN